MQTCPWSPGRLVLCLLNISAAESAAWYGTTAGGDGPAVVASADGAPAGLTANGLCCGPGCCADAAAALANSIRAMCTWFFNCCTRIRQS